MCYVKIVSGGSDGRSNRYVLRGVQQLHGGVQQLHTNNNNNNTINRTINKGAKAEKKKKKKSRKSTAGLNV